MNETKFLLETIEKWKLDVMEAKAQIGHLQGYIQSDGKEILRLRSDLSAARASNEKLREALKPFANFACDEPHINETECFNCKAKAALAESEKGKE